MRAVCVCVCAPPCRATARPVSSTGINEIKEPAIVADDFCHFKGSVYYGAALDQSFGGLLVGKVGTADIITDAASDPQTRQVPWCQFVPPFNFAIRRSPDFREILKARYRLQFDVSDIYKPKVGTDSAAFAWQLRGAGESTTLVGRDALEGKGPQRRPQGRLDRRLEEVPKRLGGGYCRLQMPLRLAFGVRETVPGRRLSALEGGNPGIPMHPCWRGYPTPTHPSGTQERQGSHRLRQSAAAMSSGTHIPFRPSTLSHPSPNTHTTHSALSLSPPSTTSINRGESHKGHGIGHWLKPGYCLRRSPPPPPPGACAWAAATTKGDGLACQPRRYRVPGQPLLNRHQVGGVSRSPDGLLAQHEREPIRGRPTVRGERTYGGWPGQRVEEQGTWAAQKHSEAGYGRPVDRGVWTAKTVKRPRQQPAHPQYANYWAPLTRKRHSHATSSTAPTHQLLGSANAETTPARAPAAAADRTQRPDATCEGKNG